MICRARFYIENESSILQHWNIEVHIFDLVTCSTNPYNERGHSQRSGFSQGHGKSRNMERGV